MSKSFDPNKMSFAACLARLNEAIDPLSFDQNEQVITSRDEVVNEALEKLQVKNMLDGFSKWQLPVYFDGPTQMFLTQGEPGIKVPSHSHDEGDGIRFIASGSIIYEGTELIAGDWMFIPAGKKYEIEIGRYGALMCYCYQCCCAQA